MIRSSRPAASVLTVLLTAGLLSACGADDFSIPTPGGEVKVDRDGDEVRIETDEGSLVTGSGALPEGFPADDVPIVEGEIISGASINGQDSQGFSVLVNVDGDLETVVAQATGLLEGAGFDEQSQTSAEGFALRSYTSDTYALTVSATELDGVTSVQYTVGVSP